MSNPFVAFSEANSCSQCAAGKSSIKNDDISSEVACQNCQAGQSSRTAGGMCEAFDKLPNGNGAYSNRPISSLGGVVDEWIKGGTERATVVAKYGEIEIWDTSDVLSLKYVFYGKRTFNEDISKWDVSSVTNMHLSTSLSFFLSLFLFLYSLTYFEL
jgi:surface protein